jgi:starch synthase
MYSMAYGTIPVVRRTGGLADTVVNATHETSENETANGFSFDEFSPAALQSTLARALRLYNDHRPAWNQLIQTGMKRDWSWNSSAKQYEELYRETMVRGSMPSHP